jgi:hypothetical protein
MEPARKLDPSHSWNSQSYGESEPDFGSSGREIPEWEIKLGKDYFLPDHRNERVVLLLVEWHSVPLSELGRGLATAERQVHFRTYEPVVRYLSAPRSPRYWKATGYQRLIVSSAQVFVRAKPIFGPGLAVTHQAPSPPLAGWPIRTQSGSRANRAIEAATLHLPAKSCRCRLN